MKSSFSNTYFQHWNRPSGHPLGYEQLLKKLRNECKRHDEYIFRGVTDANYEIQCSLRRCANKYPKTDFRKLLLDFKRDFKDELVRHGLIRDREFPASQDGLEREIEIESLAQHYGLPTRLVDWSDSPYVALFFAFAGGRQLSVTKKRPALWILNRGELELGIDKIARDQRPGVSNDEARTFFRNLNEGLFIANKYRDINQRVRLQRGWFTYFLQEEKSLDRFIFDNKKFFAKNTLTQVLLPGDIQARVLGDLELMDITSGTLFRDIEGVASMVHSRVLQYDFTT